MSGIDIEAAMGALDRDGYVVLPGLVPAQPLADIESPLRQEFERWAASDEVFRGGGMVSGHLNCYPGLAARPIYEALCERGLLDLVRRCDGPVDRLRVTMNLNLPGSHDQHYHADGLYTEQFVVCNVAVVDTDLSNGAIDMLPGTHTRFQPYWEYVLHRAYRSSTRVCMQRGDVLVRLSTVWHRGTANLSDQARPMLSFTFGEVSAPSEDPFRTDSGGPVFYPNWYRTDRMGEMRERVFVKAPWTYSTYRFARSLVGKKGYSSW